MFYKILNTIDDTYSDKAKRILNQLGKVDYLVLSQKELERRIKNYDILVIGLGLNLNMQVIDKARKLKIIATATTGLDHIDVDYTEEKRIAVLSLCREEKFLDTITSTAELAFGLILNLCRNIPLAFESVKKYRWDREKFRGHILYGKTLGIVGLGRLGKMMVKYGKAFGMKVIAVDPYVDNNVFKKLSCEQVSFDALLKKSDFISIHVHLNKETENMFNAPAFKKMKNTAYLINTSRGKVVNEKDLLKALKQKEIAGYVTDVLADELGFGKTFKKNLLVEYAKKSDNLIIVPHIGGMTYESREATDIFMAEKLKQYLLRKKYEQSKKS